MGWGASAERRPNRLDAVRTTLRGWAEELDAVWLDPDSVQALVEGWLLAHMALCYPSTSRSPSRLSRRLGGPAESEVAQWVAATPRPPPKGWVVHWSLSIAAGRHCCQLTVRCIHDSQFLFYVSECLVQMPLPLWPPLSLPYFLPFLSPPNLVFGPNPSPPSLSRSRCALCLCPA